MKKILRKILTIAIALAIMIGLGGSVVVTKENEYKLIREFGRVSRVIDTAVSVSRFHLFRVQMLFQKRFCSMI